MIEVARDLFHSGFLDVHGPSAISCSGVGLNIKLLALTFLFLPPACLLGQIVDVPIKTDPPTTQSPEVAQEANEHWPTIQWPSSWNTASDQPGYPLLENANHFNVHVASVESGSYAHHPQITRVGDRFVAAWSNHLSGEDGPGQKVIGAMSRDGESWQSLGVLFDSPDHVRESYENGRFLTAAPFVRVRDRTFAIAILMESVGYGKLDTPITGTPPSEVKTPEFGKLIVKAQGYLIREIKDSGKFGPIFWFGKTKPKPIEGFKSFDTFDQTPGANVSRAIAFEIFQKLTQPLSLCPWDFNRAETECIAADGSILCEPATLLGPEQTLVRYRRDLNGSMKLYVQFSRDSGASWSLATKTQIPDAPSKSRVGQLPDGTWFLIGNQVIAPHLYKRDPLTIGLSKDGVVFERVFSIRWKSPRFKVPTQQEKSDGRGWGFQYPDFEIHDGFLWVIYSVNKECVDVSRVPLKDISLFETGSNGDQAANLK